MSSHTVPAAAEGMSASSPLIEAATVFRRLSQTDSGFSLKVAEMLHAGEDPTALVISRLGVEAGPVLAKLLPASDSTSERVNTLFARYISFEAEQERLGALGTKEGSAQADALAKPALAVMDEITAIRDSSANADLVAARILLELMLVHPWPDIAKAEWDYEERTQLLPLLECVANQTTGAVRIETGRVLATIGINVPPEARSENDPLLAFVTAWTDAEATVQTLPTSEQDAWSAEHVAPFDDRAVRGDIPKATTKAGAVAALRRIASFPDIQAMDASLLKAALAFLEGRASQ